MADLMQALNTLPLAGLMLVVALGFTLGRIRWRGFHLGPAGGTLLVALLLGSMGLSFRELYGTADPKLSIGFLGLALFIYSVGFEAGPRFFSAFRGGPGWRFVLVGTIVNVLALILAVVLGRVLSLGEGVSAGLLAGAITSAPTFAAASEVCSDHAALSLSFAVTYPVGLVGVVLLVHLLPRWMGDDLASEEEEEPKSRGRTRVRDPERVRSFLVSCEEVAGRSLAELALTRKTGCYITRLHRGDDFSVPSAGTKLELGDHVMVKGRLDEMAKFAELVGPEVVDDELRSNMPAPRRVLVASPDAVGKTLLDLRIPQKHRCLVTGIERGGIHVEPGAEVVVERGDVFDVVGRRDAVRCVAQELGRFEKPGNETDIAIYAGGIFLGLLLGSIEIPGLPLTFKLGSAGGLLIVGVLLGRFRKIGPFSANVPAAARQLVRDLGILLFVAETGVSAGESAATGFAGWLLPTLLAAVVVTAIPVIVAVLFARNLLVMRPVDTWGSVCGGMTSSAALLALRRAADSNSPAPSYAASYAVASVLVTLAGQVVVLLV